MGRAQGDGLMGEGSLANESGPPQVMKSIAVLSPSLIVLLIVLFGWPLGELLPFHVLSCSAT